MSSHDTDTPGQPEVAADMINPPTIEQDKAVPFEGSMKEARILYAASAFSFSYSIFAAYRIYYRPDGWDGLNFMDKATFVWGVICAVIILPLHTAGYVVKEYRQWKKKEENKMGSDGKEFRFAEKDLDEERQQSP